MLIIFTGAGLLCISNQSLQTYVILSSPMTEQRNETWHTQVKQFIIDQQICLSLDAFFLSAIRLTLVLINKVMWHNYIFCFVLGFMSQSTAMVMLRRSVHFTKLFPG